MERTCRNQNLNLHTVFEETVQYKLTVSSRLLCGKRALHVCVGYLQFVHFCWGFMAYVLTERHVLTFRWWIANRSEETTFVFWGSFMVHNWELECFLNATGINGLTDWIWNMHLTGFHFHLSPLVSLDISVSKLGNYFRLECDDSFTIDVTHERLQRERNGWRFVHNRSSRLLHTPTTK